MKRKCVCCQKTKPLDKKHFQVVKYFTDGYSYYCLDCDEKLKKPKSRSKKESKFLSEKVEFKLQYKDILELAKILSYYQGELESSVDYEVDTSNIERLIKKLEHFLPKTKGGST